MHSAIHSSLPPQHAAFSAVRSLSLLAHLVKESEIISGRPGCEFVVVADDALLSYVVSTSGEGFEVSRLESHGSPSHAEYTTLHGLMTNSIGYAISTNRLFCKPL